MSVVRSKEWYIKKVSARIDEVIPAGDNIGGQTAIEAPIETIDDELDDSAHYVLRTAKLPLIFSTIKRDLKHFHGDSVNDVPTRLIIDSNKKATIVCPEDFLRFVTCRLSSWDRDVKEVMSPNDAKYRFQEGNRHTSGNKYKPQAAMVSFGEYITTLAHGVVTAGPFVVDEIVTGGTSGATATVKEVAANSLTLEYTSGHFQDGETITGGTSGASATIDAAGVVDEYHKWVISFEFTTNQDVTTLDDDNVNISTGQIFTLTNQDDEGENGTYKCNASGTPPTKLASTTTTVNSGTAIECFRAGSTSDTLEKFHYIPRLSVEQIPQDLSDAVIWHCAGRVLEYMGRMEESNAAIAKADILLGNLKLGIIGEN